MQQEINIQTKESNLNLKEEVLKYLFNWKWFAVGVFLSLLLAFLYLRYAVPQYQATAKILVKDDRKGGMMSELSAFSDLGVLGGVSSNVDNELEVLKSSAILYEVSKELELNFTYYSIGRVITSEVYEEKPLKLVFVSPSSEFLETKNQFRVEHKNDTSFTIFDKNDSKIGTFTYNKPFTIGKEKQEAILFKTEFFNKEKNYNIQIFYKPTELVVESLKRDLKVATLSKYTSVIEISYVNPVPEKAEDIINTLIKKYNEDAINDKKFISENTSKFIEQRLGIISKELREVEQNVETFKKENGVTDIISEAGIYLSNSSDVSKKILDTEIQLEVVKSLSSYLKSSSTDLIPSNVIPSSEGASSQISEYNNLVLRRNELLNSSAGSKNVTVQKLNEQIDALKQTVSSSLNQLQSNLKIEVASLKRQSGILGGKISQIPTQEKGFRDLNRRQNIKEALYLYLLQKREETQLSLAVTAPNAKVIDDAKAGSKPISPKKMIVYLGALILGLLIPFGILYLIDLFDTKIKTRKDIEDTITVPFLGEIPLLENETLILESSNRSGTAEALRIIRTNLEFVLNDVPEGKAKTIFLTSTYPKEGKTFVSVNLATIISKAEKKTLLIGLDIRNPRLDDYFNLPQKGLTHYLTDKTGKSITDFIVKSKEIETLDVLVAGVIPPNPAELLMSKKVNDMFAELAQMYDYIIVDTAPVSLVTDTLLIAKYADAFVYVSRANYLDKRMLELPQKLYTEKKLPNMTIVLNASDTKKGYGYGYGYDYGYGYGRETEKVPFWKKWLGYFKK